MPPPTIAIRRVIRYLAERRSSAMRDGGTSAERDALRSGRRGRGADRVPAAGPGQELLGRQIERGAADLTDVDREVALDDPAQEAAIRAGGELVDSGVGVLAEAEHDDVGLPAQVARWADPAGA